MLVFPLAKNVLGSGAGEPRQLQLQGDLFQGERKKSCNPCLSAAGAETVHGTTSRPCTGTGGMMAIRNVQGMLELSGQVDAELSAPRPGTG